MRFASVLTTTTLTIGLAVIATPAPAGATAATVCAGVHGCKRVARIDVDGDRRADQVGVVRTGAAAGGRVRVRVLTATGRRLSTSNALHGWGAKAWFGAARIDGRRGAELVVGSTAGAHYEIFRVITYRAGRLVTLRSPAGRARWGVDGAYMDQIGFRRSVSRGRVYMTRTSLLRDSDGTGHSGRRKVYVWSVKAKTWRLVSSRHIHVATDRAASAVGGWHVKHLPRFA